jgi:exo-beta-1,3-glucanase (GH17 family)
MQKKSLLIKTASSQTSKAATLSEAALGQSLITFAHSLVQSSVRLKSNTQYLSVCQKKKNAIGKKQNMERTELKELVLNHGIANGWKGFVGLYLTTSQLRELKRFVKQYESMTMKAIYDAL